MTTADDPPHDVDAVHAAITQAQRYDMVAEVVWSAMRAIQADPTLSIPQAMANGLCDWDC